MKAIVPLYAVATWFLIAGPCFALWEIADVSPAKAKELGIEVRSEAAGPDAVRVELEFKPEGVLKNFSHVDLRIGAGEPPLVTAPLREDRSKPGHVVVSFTADRSRLEQFHLWVMVPEPGGGTAYELRVKDFVGPPKGR